jgi:hypothetical protein
MIYSTATVPVNPDGENPVDPRADMGGPRTQGA